MPLPAGSIPHPFPHPTPSCDNQKCPETLQMSPECRISPGMCKWSAPALQKLPFIWGGFGVRATHVEDTALRKVHKHWERNGSSPSRRNQKSAEPYFLRESGRGSFPALPGSRQERVAGTPWLIDTSPPVSASVSMWPSPLHVSPSFFSTGKDTSPIGVDVPPTPLNEGHLQQPHFQTEPHSEGPGKTCIEGTRDSPLTLSEETAESILVFAEGDTEAREIGLQCQTEGGTRSCARIPAPHTASTGMWHSGGQSPVRESLP